MEDMADNVAGKAKQSEESAHLVQLLQRLNTFANYLLRKNGAGPGMLLVDGHIHKILMRSEIVVLTEILCEKFGILPEEFLGRVNNELEREIVIYQMDNRVVFTPDGAIADGPVPIKESPEDGKGN